MYFQNFHSNCVILKHSNLNFQPGLISFDLNFVDLMSLQTVYISLLFHKVCGGIDDIHAAYFKILQNLKKETLNFYKFESTKMDHIFHQVSKITPFPHHSKKLFDR